MVPTSRLTPPPRPIAILTGTTASGKTSLALSFARANPEIEIVNADSLLVFRGFDVGTAKPTREERQEITHHLIDIRNPEETYTAGDFVRDCEKIIQEIHGRGHRALIVGGTGFYLKAMIYGLWDAPAGPPDLRAKIESHSNSELYKKLYSIDEEAALRISQNDRYRLIRGLEAFELTGKTPTQLEAEAQARPPVRGIHLLLTDRQPEGLKSRIEERTRAMLSSGLVEEVQALLKTFPQARALESVGYSETVAYLRGQLPQGRKIAPGLRGLEQEIVLATQQLAKRQRTFFKGQFRGDKQPAPPLFSFILDQDREKLWEKLEEIYS